MNDKPNASGPSVTEDAAGPSATGDAAGQEGQEAKDRPEAPAAGENRNGARTRGGQRGNGGDPFAALAVVFAALLGLFEGPAEIACALALVAAIVGGVGTRRWGLADGALLGWAALGVVGMLRPEFASGSQGMLRPLLALAFVVTTLGLARAEERTLTWCGAAFFAACAINAAYGYLQVFVFDPPLEALLRGREASENLVDPEHPGRLRMATGLFYNRLKLAHVGAVALVGLTIAAARGSISGRRRATLLATAAFIGGAVFLTYRRAAPIAIFVSALFLAFALARFRVALGTLAGGGLIAAAFALTDYGRERIGTSGLDLTERLGIYQSAIEIAFAHPLGLGHGGYLRAIEAHAPEMARSLMTSPHNMLLHALVETGLVGAGLFVLGIVAAIARGAERVYRGRAAQTWTAVADRFALAGVVLIMTLGLAHEVLFHAPVALLFWSLLGWCARTGPAGDRPTPDPDTAPAR